MAFQLSSCREAIYKSLLWAFHPFDMDCGVLGLHTCFKAHTTSKGVFISSQHYASCVDLGHGTQPKTKKEMYRMDEMENICLSVIWTTFVNIQHCLLLSSHKIYFV